MGVGVGVVVGAGVETVGVGVGVDVGVGAVGVGVIVSCGDTLGDSVAGDRGGVMVRRGGTLNEGRRTRGGGGEVV